ncbi:shikimate dehydrogenase [Acinetobacter sp. B5B]|uniref:shikimate dehydrogenase n=1 Tax=Acinetobacter baretiae TaxID=2605383 RepID=UPI0018C33B8A|nr:shikimate dehydrogenase [Acinetobacter baretiae]MBF7683822.1 shikimate dehydrogenase [Acinetobacter baretiae]MBF7686104.1 shikimate dehydrogenase [Acinetobacter baretiae]
MSHIKKFAVIGNPIEQSRSPELHQAFAKKENISLTYDKIYAEKSEFKSMVYDFFTHHGVGMNVTVPFKEDAFALCDVLSDRAQAAKAVNTLWSKDGLIYGDNTDGQGLVDAIHALGWPLAHAKILILGAGGATRGVVLPLAQAGATQIVIANRTYARAAQLVCDLKALITPSTILTACPIDQISGQYDLVINATSASLSGDTLTLPKDLQFNYAYEMAYGKASSFLTHAQQRGIAYSDGFGMLVGQAIVSFEIWNGCKPKLTDFLDLK